MRDPLIKWPQIATDQGLLVLQAAQVGLERNVASDDCKTTVDTEQAVQRKRCCTLSKLNICSHCTLA